MTARTDRFAHRMASACAVLFLAGCAHQVTSPLPVVSSVEPRVVCTEQRTTTLTLRGSHLTPLPIRTLGGVDGGSQPQTLQLPAISLQRVFSLEGMMLAGDAGGADGGSGYRIFDDYDNPMMSHVAWSSESAMAFDIYPQLMLAPGVYDLTVENPDGIHRSTLPNAIAAVPPPHVTGIVPPAICVAQGAQMVTLNGSGFLRIGMNGPTVTITPEGGGTPHEYTPTDYTSCSTIAANVVMGLQTCGGVTITIPQNDLPPGRYTVQITNPAPADCHSSEMITLIVAPPPDVISVTPMTICQGGGTLAVSGTAFAMGAGVTLGTTPASTVMVSSSTQLTATFGGGSAMFNPGDRYDLTVTNPDGCHDTLPNAVTAVAGPVVFFADPPVVYNGITTRVTLYSTSVTPPLMTVTMTTGGGTPITLVSSIDPAHPHRILATVPMGTPAGDYDITVTDSSGCPATLPHALRVTATTTVMITSIDPPFGWQNGATAVTINAVGGLMATPRAYLNPHTSTATTIATALSSVAFVSATRLTAIVPQGLDPASNPYDLIVVNPDGSVGVLTMPVAALYQSIANPPPVIDSISPVAVPNTGPPAVTITGENFRMPVVTFRCITDIATGTRMTFPATIGGTPTATTITIPNPPVGTLPAPSLCTIRVTNGDGSYGEYSALAISNSSGNLSASRAGPVMPTARRASALLGGDATRAAHFLYVVGGDNGAPAGALDTIDTIDTNENGYGTAWFQQRYHLNAPRTLAGYASLGRYLYVLGGRNTTAAVDTVERAMVLDPLQAPQITDVDIVPGMGTGQAGGIWYYRVAAVMAAADPDNPGGETLPSDEFPIQLPDITQRLQVTLTWRAVPGAAGYVVYRTPMPNQIAGQEQLLATVTSATAVTYTDTGTATMAGTPLQLGSTGRWRVLAALTTSPMGTVRESPYAVFGVDPATPTAHYLYATFGRSATAALASYEFLRVDVAPTTGQQTPAATWTDGTTTSALPRSLHYAYSATHENSSFVPAGTNYIYVGGGSTTGTTNLMALDSSRVQAGGQLTAWVATGTRISSFGAGATVAANYLYTFGDENSAQAIRAGQIDMAAPPAVTNFNNNGTGLVVGRYLPGTALQGAYVYVIGGSAGGRTSASNTVESMIW